MLQRIPKHFQWVRIARGGSARHEARHATVKNSGLKAPTAYCDTSVLPDIPVTEAAKRAAMLRPIEIDTLKGSHLVKAKVGCTSDEPLCALLLIENDALPAVAIELLGFNSHWDRHGGWSAPIISDVQDEPLPHVAHASRNGCGVFPTRDWRTII